jgi:hypothetical protein
VQSGTFVVNGNLSGVGGITVEAGATLGGTGMLSSTTINNGGRLAPGPPNSIGTLRVIGNLVLANAANYLVQASPTAAGLTTISRTASLGGPLVANGTGGAYAVGHKYAVLTASGGVIGTFSSLAVTGSFGATRPSITYDANDAFLVLVPAALQLPPGAPTNVTKCRPCDRRCQQWHPATPLPEPFQSATATAPERADRAFGGGRNRRSTRRLSAHKRIPFAPGWSVPS